MPFKRSQSLALLVLPLSACTTMGFPHIGTVDTRSHQTGTVHAQFSGGLGTVGALYPGGVAAGAQISADTYLDPEVSMPVSADILISPFTRDEFSLGARAGLRFRPNPRLSLGFGGFARGGMSKINGDTHVLGYGGDIEITTSTPKPKGRFVSHAWRLIGGHSTHNEYSFTVLGDWSRSRPFRDKNYRISYGMNYGFTYYGEIEQVQESQENDPHENWFGGEGPGLFVGGHIGIQWGRGRGR